MSNDDLEEGVDDFTTHCHDPMEDDSVSIIAKLGLLKQIRFIYAYKNCDNSDDCGEWDGHICCKSTKFDQILAGTKLCR